MGGDPDLYYDRDSQPVTHDQWRALRSNDEYVRIAFDYTADPRIWVSTVWLGLNQNWNGRGPVLIYETMVYPACEQHWYYATEEQARAGHAGACRALRDGDETSQDSSAVCLCGHPRAEHEHHWAGADCALDDCDCEKYSTVE